MPMQTIEPCRRHGVDGMIDDRGLDQPPCFEHFAGNGRTRARYECAAVLFDADDTLMCELEQRRAHQRAARAIDLADLVLTELRSWQQPVLENRRHHAFPDPADAVVAAISRGRGVRLQLSL